MNPRAWSLLTAACALGCAGAPVTSAVPPDATAASAQLARLIASEPATFRMTHQVVARFQGKAYPMTGYLLGRRDGSFRVSASTLVGPKLFDVTKVSGKWDSKIYLPEAAARLDPLEIGRAVERIYFLGAKGELKFEQGAWLTRQSVDGEDVDVIEVWRDAEDLGVVRKRFFRKERQVLEITYEERGIVRGQSIAKRVLFKDARGFSLELAVTDYQPGFPVPDERLRIGE